LGGLSAFLVFSVFLSFLRVDGAGRVSAVSTFEREVLAREWVTASTVAGFFVAGVPSETLYFWIRKLQSRGTCGISRTGVSCTGISCPLS
jgi:hypothetical protein